MSRRQPVSPENCPTPEYHETHRYCPSCTWTEQPPEPVIRRRHPLDVPAAAAYGAFRLSSRSRLGELPPWDDLPPDAQADWRAVADAVQMITDMGRGEADSDPS